MTNNEQDPLVIRKHAADAATEKNRMTSKHMMPTSPSTMAQDQSGGTGFFDLPRELRDKIYSHAFPKHTKFIEPIPENEARDLRVVAAALHPNDVRRFMNLQVINVPIPFVNPQFYLEAMETWVRDNEIMLGGDRHGARETSYGFVHLTRDLDRALPGDPFRKRVGKILNLAHDVRIKLHLIDREAWWLKLLQVKENLYSVVYTLQNVGNIETPGTFAFEAISDKDGMKEDLLALLKVSVKDFGLLMIGDGAYYFGG